MLKCCKDMSSSDLKRLLAGWRLWLKLTYKNIGVLGEVKYSGGINAIKRFKETSGLVNMNYF